MTESQTVGVFAAAALALTAIPVIALFGFVLWLVVTRVWCPPARRRR